jgi:hypothetical protein
MEKGGARYLSGEVRLVPKLTYPSAWVGSVFFYYRAWGFDLQGHRRWLHGPSRGCNCACACCMRQQPDVSTPQIPSGLHVPRFPMPRSFPKTQQIQYKTDGAREWLFAHLQLHLPSSSNSRLRPIPPSKIHAECVLVFDSTIPSSLENDSRGARLDMVHGYSKTDQEQRRAKSMRGGTLQQGWLVICMCNRAEQRSPPYIQCIWTYICSNSSAMHKVFFPSST